MRVDTHPWRYTLDLDLVPDPGSASKISPALAVEIDTAGLDR
jgi:hypothetical protein